MNKSVYVMSDGTGETAMTMIRAALVQYKNTDFGIKRYKNIRTEPQLEMVINEAASQNAIVIYTIASLQLRLKVKEFCANKGLQFFDLLGPLFTELDSYFEVNTESTTTGALRTIDEKYFKRVAAIEYTVKHDDGKELRDLDQADIILVGISRTSKTPLSIFLSHKGWKVANIPLVLNQPIPTEVFEVDQRKVVGLLIDQDSLFRIRRNRLEKFGQDPGGEYASHQHIHLEIEYALELFKKNKRWPVFNVTERALEETASEITKIVASRMGFHSDIIF